MGDMADLEQHLMELDMTEEEWRRYGGGRAPASGVKAIIGLDDESLIDLVRRDRYGADDAEAAEERIKLALAVLKEIEGIAHRRPEVGLEGRMEHTFCNGLLRRATRSMERGVA